MFQWLWSGEVGIDEQSGSPLILNSSQGTANPSLASIEVSEGLAEPRDEAVL